MPIWLKRLGERVVIAVASWIEPIMSVFGVWLPAPRP
jgi:hypothetical protein